MIVFAIWLAETPVASEVFRQESRTSRIALWCSSDRAVNQLWLPDDGLALSRISFAKSILLFLEVNPPVVVGDTAGRGILVVIQFGREDQSLGWKCLAHD
jgi:hypothetical protein